MGKQSREASESGGRISFRLFGFSFWQAWWVLAMCSAHILPGRSMSATLFQSVFCITILTTASYLLVVVLSRRFGPFSSRKVFYVLAGGLATVGSLGAELVYAPFPIRRLLPPLYRMCGSVFRWQALLLIMWGELWSTLATGRVGRYLYASYAFAFVLYFAVIALPHAVAKFYDLSVPHRIHGYPEVVEPGTEKKPFPS